MSQGITSHGILHESSAVSPLDTPGGRLGVVELYAGAAGLAQGFLRTGCYDLIALSDRDANAQTTFNRAFPHIPYIIRDIGELQSKDVMDKADGRRVVGLLGGPPCQGFSLAGRRNPDDERNKHISNYVRFVEGLDPDFLLMENVPQVFFHPLFQELLRYLARNFNVHYAVLNAALYGVPQTRHRAFLLAFHRRLQRVPKFPQPTHGFAMRDVFNYCQRKMVSPGIKEVEAEILGADPVIGARPELVGVQEDMRGQVLPLVTVEDAISDLPSLASGASVKEYAREPQTEYQRTARNGSTKLLNHVARAHSVTMLKMVESIPPGGDLADVDRIYWPKSHYSQAYGRLHNQGLARTVTTFFCNAGSGRFLHPSDTRTITVREAARLQGFLDQLEFTGTQEQQMTLVGNAVPLPLAAALGQQVWADIGELLLASIKSSM